MVQLLCRGEAMDGQLARLISLLLCAGFALAATDSVTIYDVDNVAQANRPTTFGRVFAAGEILDFPQPLCGGVLVTGNNWQADVKNRYNDGLGAHGGSVRYAIISVICTVPQAGNVAITFQNNATAGNNSGYLATKSDLLTFNSS